MASRLEVVAMEALVLLERGLKDRGMASLRFPALNLAGSVRSCHIATDDETGKSLRVSTFNTPRGEIVLAVDVSHGGKVVTETAEFSEVELIHGLDQFHAEILVPLINRLVNRIAPIIAKPYTAVSTGLIGHQVYS